jgi:prepilin-type N-terminal cleavage/methylation domain-containing protein
MAYHGGVNTPTLPHAARAGLSLIEVMITAVLIGVLAAVSIPNALRARVSGNDNTAKMIVSNVATRQESYKGEFNCYYPKNVACPATASLTFHPNDPIFIPGIRKPDAYSVYFTAITDEDTSQERYCIVVMHSQRQSNAWLWTSGHSGEYTRIDRENVSNFEDDANAACGIELAAF